MHVIFLGHKTYHLLKGMWKILIPSSRLIAILFASGSSSHMDVSLVFSSESENGIHPLLNNLNYTTNKYDDIKYDHLQSQYTQFYTVIIMTKFI